MKELNYVFSTSACPLIAYHRGPLFKEKDIVEIPLTGIYTEPFNVMDTWAYFAAPNRTKQPSEFVDDARSLARFANKHPILINIYGDPSHIHDKREFFEAMDMLKKAAKNMNYSQLLKATHENIRYI